MKAYLNECGVFVNNIFTEVEIDPTHTITIRVANCDDGYRAKCEWHWGNWGVGSPVMKSDEPYKKDYEAIIAAIADAIKCVDKCREDERNSLKKNLEKLIQEYKEQRFQQLNLF